VNAGRLNPPRRIEAHGRGEPGPPWRRGAPLRSWAAERFAVSVDQPTPFDRALQQRQGDIKLYVPARRVAGRPKSVVSARTVLFGL